LCQSAQKIVIYCNGGNCEDSQFAALTLRDAQIPNEKLFVFTGGITEWTNHSYAIELGERNSGRTRK
jgi:rhodanese-related sulfurtransferase